jgi:aminoethylphosphonate catabolism LysR family transcriptional regulator
MRYTQLRSFHAVSATGSVTAAARQLNVSQPTLTTQIKALEAEYGVELFSRFRGRLILTTCGQQLRLITNRLFSDEDEARQFLTESGELRTGHLRMGAVGPFHVTEMLIAFHALYPGIGISVSIGNSKEVLTSLLKFESDVAVLAFVERDPQLRVSQFSRDEIIAIGQRSHPLFGPSHKELVLSDLHGQPMVMRERGSNTRKVIEEALADAGVVPRIVMEIGSREAVREAVANGVGVGIVSGAEHLSDSRIRPLPFRGTKIYNHSHVVCMEVRAHSRVIGRFLEVVEELRKSQKREPR